MNDTNSMSHSNIHMRRQDGVVLFIALIALVVIMLAAIALVRSVDTGNLIAGNVAFRRAATSSADSGLESAIAWLAAKQTEDSAINPFLDDSHALNQTNAAKGFYSSYSNDPADASFLDVTSAALWADESDDDDERSASGGMDASGNSIRYIIQRMCKTPNQKLTAGDCIFSDRVVDTDSKKTSPPTPEKNGSSVMYRVTARVTGPRNTISYIQAFIY